MIEVLTYLMTRFPGLSGQPIPERVVLALRAAGFDNAEVDTAMEWLNAVSLDRPSTDGCQRTIYGHRVYAKRELRTLGTGGIAFLSRLEANGHLDFLSREAIVDWAFRFSEVPVSYRRLRVIALALLWRRSVRLDPLLVQELIADQPVTLH